MDLLGKIINGVIWLLEMLGTMFWKVVEFVSPLAVVLVETITQSDAKRSTVTIVTVGLLGIIVLLTLGIFVALIEGKTSKKNKAKNTGEGFQPVRATREEVINPHANRKRQPTVSFGTEWPTVAAQDLEPDAQNTTPPNGVQT